MPSVEIRRVVAREAYARNGNAHNPTKYYRWDVYVGGRCMASYERQRDAKAAVPALVDEYCERWGPLATAFREVLPAVLRECEAMLAPATTRGG